MVMVRSNLILVTVLALWGTARADVQEAKKHYERGTRAFNLQDWKGALAEFQRAYVEQPDPVFLFNIAQAQRQLGQSDAASKSYRLYLANAPDAPNRDRVMRLIEEMDKAAAEGHAKTPPTGTQTRASVVAQPTATPTPPARGRKWYESPLGWGLVGGGVAVVGVSGGLLGVAMSERDKAVSAPTQPDFDTHHNRSITFQQAGWPLLGVGSALVVGGAVVLALNARRARQ